VLGNGYGENKLKGKGGENRRRGKAQNHKAGRHRELHIFSSRNTST